MENQEIIEKIKSTYGFYHQKYVVMTEKFTKTVNHYFKDQVIESHLKGNYALATFAGENATRFLSVDIDEGGKKVVRQVIDAFVEMGVPRDRIYVSMSGKKGYHVEMFFAPWLYNKKAQNLYELMIAKTGLDPKKVEFRPTFRQAVKIPLGIHATTKNRCWYLDPETLKPIERMDYILSIVPIPDEDIYNILKAMNKKRWNELYADIICNETGSDNTIQKDLEFNSEYYEQHRIKECGTRHDIMMEIACDLRHYGANRFQIQKALRGFYYRQDSKYIKTSERDVLTDIESIAEWAEESVPVWKQRRVATDKPRRVKFNKEEIDYLLNSSKNAARKVAFLLWSYCKIFGAAHVSYTTIADIIGCRIATVEHAISTLIKNNVISKKSGGCHYKNGMLVRESNTYFIPNTIKYKPPDDECVVTDSYEFEEKVQKETFSSLYYRTLAGIFKTEYLAKFLSKSDMEELQNGCLAE